MGEEFCVVEPSERAGVRTMDSTKKWWLSKTIIVNIVSAGIAVVSAAAGTDLIAQHPQAAAIAAATLAGLNIALRFITVLPIGG